MDSTPSEPISDHEVLALLQEGRPLSDLLTEVIALRRWKEQRLAEQKKETARMERMLTRLCGNCKETATRWIRHENGSTDDLPVELLHTIFRFVLPPSSLLDPTPSRGTRSLWTRTAAAKQTLWQVSKRWHSYALPFIFEEVSFRYAGQVLKFARSLRENNSLAALVRRIVVDCPVISEIRDSVISELAYIITHCSGLRSLVFTDALFAMEDDLRRVALYHFPNSLTAAVKSVAGHLQRFEQWPQGGTPHFTFPIHCITSSPSLVALTININHPALLDSVTLPTLEELDLSQEYDVEISDYSNHFRKWELPSLKRLVLPMATDIQGRVLKKWGKTIEYLEFRDHLDMSIHNETSSTRYPYVEFIHLCPILRHLVFQAEDMNEFHALNRLPAHPTLAYIDVWATSPAGYVRYLFEKERRERKLAPDVPWKNVRLLDRALSAILQLPRLFPPDTPETDIPSTHTISDITIVHHPWGVFRADLYRLYRLEPINLPEEDAEGELSEDAESLYVGSDGPYMDDSTPSEDTETESEDDMQDDVSVLYARNRN